jgi:serine/threonine-protein kinase
MVSRFVAEARAVNQIRHPNIIDIFSFGALPDGRQYYVMEFLDGKPLDVYIHMKKRLTLDEAVPILRGIVKALDAAHAKGIAHRDLKAENVLLAMSSDGEITPMLLDFGIAKLSGDDAIKHKTRTGAPMGTPVYMSPEQSRGRDVDYRTDLYALGVLVYLMLTGVFPLDGDDYMTILMRQCNDEPAPPSTHVADLPEAVDQTCAWLMRKDPADRPPNASTALQALEGLVTVAAPKRVATTANLHARSPITRDTPASHQASQGPWGAPVPGASGFVSAQSTMPPPGRRTGLLVGLVGLVAIGAVVAIVAMRSGKNTTKQPVVADAAPVVVVDAMVMAAEAAVPVVDAPPSDITIQIAGLPDGAEVRQAGDLVGVAPGPATIHRREGPIVLTISADGYKPTTLTVTADKLAYKVTLVKKGGTTRPPHDNTNHNTGSATDDIDTFPDAGH